VQLFQFKPRHPVQQVGFSFDNAYFITAQPQVGVAVRDRMSGESVYARVLPRGGHRLYFNVCRNAPLIGVSGLVWRWDAAEGATQFVPVRNWCWPAFTEHEVLEVALAYSNISLAMFTQELLAREQQRSAYRSEGDFFNISPNAQFAFGCHRDSNPVILNISTKKVAAKLRCRLRQKHQVGWKYVFACSSNSDRVALGQGEEIAVFDLSSLMEINTAEHMLHLDPILTLERPDPSIHGTVADKAAKHWLPPVAFTRCGRYLLTLGLRNRVQKWDIFGGGLVNEWGWRMERIDSLAVSWDGLTAIAGGALGKVVVWDLE
jgi:hypothetical protein